MSTLDELVPDRAKIAPTGHVGDPRWEQAKRAVDGLSRLYLDVLRARLKTHPRLIRKYPNAKKTGSVVEAALDPIEGYEAQLVIVEGDGQIRSAKYYLFDQGTMTSYVRDVLL